MGLLKRVFGISNTKKPSNPDCWDFSSGHINLDLTKIPELNSETCAVRLEGKDLPYRVLVIHGSDKKFHAIKNKCSHGGRRIDILDNSDNLMCCSVGKSTFKYSGELISGSAKKDIRSLELEQNENILKIKI